MARTQRSIDVKAPVHLLYDQLIQFEDYPRFMTDVESVRQIDDTHLHWSARMADRPVEWDAEICEQEPDRCIAWRSLNGPRSAGKVEVQEVGPDSSRVTFTLESEPQQTPDGAQDNLEHALEQRVQHNLARLKELVESRRPETSAGQSMPAQETGQVAELGIAQGAAQAGDQAAGTQTDKVAELGASQGSGQVPGRATPAAATDQPKAGSKAQPVGMRHIGQMPQDTTAEQHGGSPTSDSMGKPMEPGGRGDA